MSLGLALASRAKADPLKVLHPQITLASRPYHVLHLRYFSRKHICVWPSESKSQSCSFKTEQVNSAVLGKSCAPPIVLCAEVTRDMVPSLTTAVKSHNPGSVVRAINGPFLVSITSIFNYFNIH